jgi:lipopolysaccharide export system protein LptC
MALSALLGRARKQRLTMSDAAAPRPLTSGDTAYDAALRHSRRVRFLRKFIPVGCVTALVGPLAWGIIAPFASTVPDIKIGAISVSGSKITMESPKLSGFKKDQKSYEVTAREAIQDIKAPSIVELNMLTGRMEQEKNSFARLTSDWGKFDQGNDRLDLKGNVRVRTDSGYEVDMLSAQVNMKSGDIVSTEPVTVRSKTGTVSANQVEVKENGKIVIFEGRVRSVFVSDEQTATPAKETRTQ